MIETLDYAQRTGSLKSADVCIKIGLRFGTVQACLPLRTA